MGKNKEYQIKTVQDMVDCTNIQNIDNFLKDLKGVLLSGHLLKSIDGSVKSDGFIWIDDGKHKTSIEISSNEAP